jgi:sensor c-di-GMP phosphodiesterase-like protein
VKGFTRITWLIVVGVVITTALPILAAITLARQQAHENDRSYALDLARSALLRSEMTGDQLAVVSRVVGSMTPDEACSPAGLDTLRRLDLSSTLLQAVGVVEGNTMRCSSLGGLRKFALGPPDLTSINNVDFRTHVKLFDPDLSYLAVSGETSIAIVHKDLVLSFVEDVPGLRIGVFSWSQHKMLMSRGTVPPELYAQTRARESAFRHGGDLVVVVKSKRYDLGAIAVLPPGAGTSYAGQAAMVLIPIGVLVGLILSALLVHVVRTRVSMPAMIKTALAQRKFHLHYQPMVELASGRIIGAEALIRWDRGSAGEIPTDRFIDAAEEAGLIHLITAHVFELLAMDARSVLAIAPDFRFSVNLSASDLHRPSILGEVTRLIETSGLGPHNLVIEATERSLVDVERARETMGRLREMGIRLAIDDFGTGYSSLAYLAQIEADFLKIDRLFVQALGTESATSQVAERIIEMGKDLKLAIVAEGIETQGQEQLLKALRVEFAQGYLYGQAMAADDLLVRLRTDRRKFSQRRLKAVA